MRPRGTLPANHPARAFDARFAFTPDGAERVEEGTGPIGIRLRAER
jgi:hypothetical protein